MKTIEISDLEFGYGDSFALGPLGLEFAAGSRTALVGPSGCGKSTLLRLLAGLERPRRGTIAIGERIVAGGAVFVPPSERRIGFVFQDNALWPHLTAAGHLRFADPSLAAADARALLERVGLGHAVDRRPAGLSGGEAQRLALARALVGSPDVLLLDEPLASVDVHLRDELCALIQDVAAERDLTVVVVTHDRDEAFALADHLVVLRDGRVVERGPARDLLRAPKTAFSARFLAGAACLPVERAGGEVVTPLGRFPATGEGTTLVVLPGDVRLGAAGNGTAQGVVRHVRLDPFGAAVARVDVGGATFHVTCAEPPAVGATVGVAFVVPPRLLAE